MAPELHDYAHRIRRDPLKILILSACLLGLLGPTGGLPGKKNIKADELAGIGVGAAALVGVIGYLVIRKRNSA